MKSLAICFAHLLEPPIPVLHPYASRLTCGWADGGNVNGDVVGGRARGGAHGLHQHLHGVAAGGHAAHAAADLGGQIRGVKLC